MRSRSPVSAQASISPIFWGRRRSRAASTPPRRREHLPPPASISLSIRAGSASSTSMAANMASAGRRTPSARHRAGQYYVSDPNLRQQILDLRNHPETASVMAAEHAADNKARLESSLGREAQPVDLYLAHFLGVGGATKFLAVLRSISGRVRRIAVSVSRAGQPLDLLRQGGQSAQPQRNSQQFRQPLQQGSAGAMAAARTHGPAAPTTMISPMPAAASERAASDYAREQTARLQNSISSEDLIRPQPPPRGSPISCLQLLVAEKGNGKILYDPQ
jgi:hypothetical protein